MNFQTENEYDVRRKTIDVQDAEDWAQLEKEIALACHLPGPTNSAGNSVRNIKPKSRYGCGFCASNNETHTVVLNQYNSINACVKVFIGGHSRIGGIS